MYNKTQATFEMSLNEGDEVAQEWRITASKQGVQVAFTEAIPHTLCHNEACELLSMLNSAINFSRSTQKTPEEWREELGSGLFD